jgi:glycosyltransferase involved in cell wall biosynthesis
MLFLSRLHPKKGIVDFLLPAFARLKADAFLAIAGGQDVHSPGHESEVRAAVRQLGLSDRVAILGSVPPSQRWWLYDGAAVFVLPSRSENFGVVVAEAMARSTPVLVTEPVQAAEHVRRAGAGLVVPMQVSKIATDLEVLLANSELRAAMGRKGEQYSQEYFSWARIAGLVVSTYRAVMGSEVASTYRRDDSLTVPGAST